VHAFEHMAAAYKAPAGLNEMEIAGGLRGEPAHLVRAKTVDVMVPANAEIVLEGELLPNGWTADEGPFGEFAGHARRSEAQPAVSRRRHHASPQSYFLRPANAVGKRLAERPRDRSCVQAGAGACRDPGCGRACHRRGCCGWSVVAAIKKRAGEGRNALAALLSLPVVKQAIVTDDDIDIYNSNEVEWAVTFRCQADKDIIILSG
jgi:3-polyprenyl-4-hydroxybenzoate decarboxylase and related decarboxylases